MSQITVSPVPIEALFERTLRALAQADAESAARVLADCPYAEAPGSAEEFSRALTQKVALERMLEQTGRNLRVLRGEEDDFRYGSRHGRKA